MMDRRKALTVIGAGCGAAVAASCGTAEARGNKQLPPKALGLLYDGTLCVGCNACVSACKQANGMPPENETMWDRPVDISGKTLNIIKAYRSGSAAHKDQIEDGFAFTKMSCFHCIDPSCVSACPVSAMTKDHETGIVKYNVEACIGCRYCVAACPFGVPRFTYDTPDPKISKCQLCQHRFVEGKYSACAEVCPTGATLFGPVEELRAEVARRRALKPGTKTMFPRGRIGDGLFYEGHVGTYVDHVYGEKEIGGTQVLHLSGVPFELLDKPPLPDVPPARISESVQHAIYNHLIAPLGFLGVLGGLAWKHMRQPPGEGDGGDEGAAKGEGK